MFLPPNPVKHNSARENVVHINIRTTKKHVDPQKSARSVIAPVDPTGPHCYRDRTKTC